MIWSSWVKVLEASCALFHLCLMLRLSVSLPSGARWGEFAWVFFSWILVKGITLQHDFYPHPLFRCLKSLQGLLQRKPVCHQCLDVHLLGCKHADCHGPPERRQKYLKQPQVRAERLGRPEQSREGQEGEMPPPHQLTSAYGRGYLFELYPFHYIHSRMLILSKLDIGHGLIF